MNDNRPALEWCTYQRIGSIEARPWSTEDEYEFQCGIGPRRVSISPADRETGKVHGLHGGMVARNPANHEDQWYIAPEFFVKHYRRPDSSADRMAEALRYIVGKPAGSLPDGVRRAAEEALRG